MSPATFRDPSDSRHFLLPSLTIVSKRRNKAAHVGVTFQKHRLNRSRTKFSKNNLGRRNSSGERNDKLPLISENKDDERTPSLIRRGPRLAGHAAARAACL